MALSVIGLSLQAGVLLLLGLIVRRLYFSRLSHIPGPKLAAITRLYQAYWDLFPKHGQFLFNCVELHKQYGPIVRIGPDEVHVDDPSFYNEMYGLAGRQRDKSDLWSRLNNFSNGSTFTTVHHSLHQIRRAGLGSTLSIRSVQELEPRIHDKVLQLRSRILKKAETEELLNLKDAFAGMSLDIISLCCFGRGVGGMDRPDSGRKWNRLVRDSVKLLPTLRAVPAVTRWLAHMPRRVFQLAPLYKDAMDFVHRVKGLTFTAMDEAVEDLLKAGPTKVEADGRSRTMLHTLIRSDTLPEHEKTFSRLAADLATMLACGTETTSQSLSVTIYHLLRNEAVSARLLRELRTVMPLPKSPLPSVAQLEQLPYLTAVIHEGLRMSHSVAGRLERVAPDEDLVYEDKRTGRVFRIPRGSTFSQSSYLVHTNEELFPKPFEFNPDRFYRANGEVSAAERSLVVFGKGTRACVGINLAWAELYLTIAALIGSVHMVNADHVTDKAAEISSEFFIGCLPDDSALEVKVLGEL